jgi:hypothetical protein
MTIVCGVLGEVGWWSNLVNYQDHHDVFAFFQVTKLVMAGTHCRATGHDGSVGVTRCALEGDACSYYVLQAGGGLLLGPRAGRALQNI